MIQLGGGMKVRALWPLACLLLAACGAQPEDFVGAWEDVSDPKAQLHITRRSDEAFTVRNAAGTNFEAILKDGELRITVDETPISLAYDPSRDQLLRGRTAFKRKK
jgi:hypothetical protein